MKLNDVLQLLLVTQQRLSTHAFTPPPTNAVINLHAGVLNKSFTRMLVASHKTGSSMTGKVGKAACASLGLKSLPDDPMREASRGTETCMRQSNCFNCNSDKCKREPSAMTCADVGGPWRENPKTNPKQSCCYFPEFAWESRDFRMVAILRDPVHLIVSHFWYHFDGHEHPGPPEVYRNDGHGYPLNITRGLIHEMSPTKLYHGYGNAAHHVGVINQLVRRNAPDKAQIACLEDFMVTEDSFVVMWKRVFQFLGLPISEASLREQQAFRELNPLSKHASQLTLEHGTANHKEKAGGHSRAEEKLRNARTVLELDAEISERYQPSSTFTTYRRLSDEIRCWDWATNSRGAVNDDEWMVRSWEDDDWGDR